MRVDGNQSSDDGPGPPVRLRPVSAGGPHHYVHVTRMSPRPAPPAIPRRAR